jgi:hypothetical protein
MGESKTFGQIGFPLRMNLLQAINVETHLDVERQRSIQLASNH